MSARALVTAARSAAGITLMITIVAKQADDDDDDHHLDEGEAALTAFPFLVTPAKAGVHTASEPCAEFRMDSSLRWNDEHGNRGRTSHSSGQRVELQDRQQDR